MARARHEDMHSRGVFVAPGRLKMRPTTLNDLERCDPNPKPAWARVWHLWTIIIPRQSITGWPVWGRVWRRHDGRRWLYKRFVEFDDPQIKSSP